MSGDGLSDTLFTSGDFGCYFSGPCPAADLYSLHAVPLAFQASPTTSVIIPSNNATVSGTSQVLDAFASAGVTKVQYEITGGALTNSVIASASPTYYGWIGLWNTTSVPNGTYTLQSLASYAGGVTGTSPPITITVDNPPPSTSVIIPSNNATVSGTSQVLDAFSSAGVTKEQYEITGGALTNSVIASASPTYYGWIGLWNTTSVPNGTYTLQSLASYAGGVTGTSPPITITVDNPPPSTSVIIPSNNATVSGTSQVLDAFSSAGVTKEQYEITGGALTNSVIASASPTYYGWIGLWNTTSVPNGTYTLQSLASYAGGVTGTSPPITITVAN